MSAAIRAAQLGLQDGVRREARDAGRHLPERRLHPVEGAAAVLAPLRGGGARASPSTASPSDGVGFDLATMLARKDQVVKQLTPGVAGLFKKNKVEHIFGHATSLRPTRCR